MRIYDATGMGFLQNYVGPAHAALLATLGDRTAVVFGRASSCNSPIILRLNNAEDFREAFWENCVVAVPVTEPSLFEEPEQEEPEQNGQGTEPPFEPDEDDGIPF
jgi:hypothetical protein